MHPIDPVTTDAFMLHIPFIASWMRSALLLKCAAEELKPCRTPMSTNPSRTRWFTLALCVALHVGHAEDPSAATPSSDSSPSSTTESSSPTDSSQTVAFTELQPITVRARVARSPKGDSLRLKVVSGRTQDRLDRSILRESPKFAALRQRRETGFTPDLLPRDVPGRSPKAEALLLSQD